jgi:5-methylcytosine-specific restriction endonuclease McrA
MSRDGCGCHLCGHELTVKSATLDHLVPKSQGGTLANHNVKLACLRCNSLRGNQPVEIARNKIASMIPIC